VPNSSGRRDTSGDNDAAFPRRRKGRSKNLRLERSKKLQVRKLPTEPQLDIIELRRRLTTGKRLPKDALIESSRWRLDTNCHRKRDRQNERIMLKALIGAGSSEGEQRQALEQANCTPDARCRRLMCWLCKHRAWLTLRRKLADTLSHDVPPDDISWVTIVIAVCEPAAKALRGPMAKFRRFLRKAADAWGVVFFGRFEIDLLLDPQVDVGTTPFKRETLRALGLDPSSSNPVAVFHAHLIAYHPQQDRGWLSLRLKQKLEAPRQTHIESLRSNQSQTEALDNLTRYPLKSLPPEAAMHEDGSKSCRAHNRKTLRLHNRLVSFLDGENGDCVAKPTDAPRTT
jgi:hypothetical protein